MSLSSLSSLSDEESTNLRPKPKIIKPGRSPPKLDAFNIFSDTEFRRRFRVSKETALYLLSSFGDAIKSFTNRNKPIHPVDQILMTLRFYAGGNQKEIANTFQIKQPTVHRIVHKVTARIASMKTKHINMPTSEEFLDIAYDFYSLAGFPRAIGVVGCTHIKIHSPGGTQAEYYRNKKGYFSLNVQIVCDAKLKIRNIVARWPGSVHNNTIFDNSPLCAQLDNGYSGSMVILGDCSYPCRPYLLTPLLNPWTRAEEAYNWSQMGTRNSVQRLFGVLKRRFPCLKNGMGLKIENIPPIIVACAVLHNIALERHDELLEEDDSTPIVDEEPMGQAVGLETNQNCIVRTSLINTHFSSL